MRGDRGDQACRCRRGVPETSALSDGGGGTALALHQLNIFPGAERERRLRRKFGLQPPLGLFLDGVDPVIEFGLGLVALPARLDQGDVGETAQRQFALDAAASIAKAPEQGAGWLHQQIQAVRIGHLVGTLCRSQRPVLHNPIIAPIASGRRGLAMGPICVSDDRPSPIFSAAARSAKPLAKRS